MIRNAVVIFYTHYIRFSIHKRILSYVPNYHRNPDLVINHLTGFEYFSAAQYVGYVDLMVCKLYEIGVV